MSRLYVSGKPFISVSRAIKLPNTLPVLPRASSAKSGLRFCGMMLLPVVYSSLIRMNANSSDDQSTSSSAIRDRCIMHIAAAD